MSVEDLLQYGRLEILLLQTKYKKIEPALVKKHLSIRFIDLFRKSIGTSSLNGKTFLKRNNDLNQVSFVPIEEVQDEIVDNSYQQIENLIDLKTSVQKILKSDMKLGKLLTRYESLINKKKKPHKEINVLEKEIRKIFKTYFKE